MCVPQLKSGMAIIIKTAATFLILSFATLLGGCFSPHWELPPNYAESKYPVLTAIHGVIKSTTADDLQSTCTTYTPFADLARNTNTTHGWLIKIERIEKPILVQEVYTLPEPARWGSKESPVSGMVLNNRTTCITTYKARKGTEYVGKSWGMYADDPLGEYRKVIFLDNKFAAEFRFRVTATSSSTTTTGDKQ